MATVIIMPRLGLNEDENMLGEWFVSEGDVVQKGDPLFSIETDKSSMNIYAEEPGTVLKRLYKEYDIIPVMTPVCITGEPGEDISDIKPQAATQTEAPTAQTHTEPRQSVSEAQTEKIGTPAAVHASDEPQAVFSPRAKALAQANGITIADVTASGAENRVLEEDVINAIKTQHEPVAQAAAPTPAPAPATGRPTQPMAVSGKPVRISNVRRVIAKNMMSSLLGTAQTTTQMRYNASKVQAYRAWLKASPGPEKNITLNDMVMFAAIKALEQYPAMNAHMVSDDEMVYFDHVNIACAVSTEKGLLVPTVKNAQSLDLLSLSTSLKTLVGKCRDGTIAPDEMSDATFTVSNVGSYGVTYFTPILNPPQVGILGVGTIDYAVRMTDEGMLYYPAGYLSLTYDHRAIDGAPAAEFLRAVCQNLEDFYSLVGGQKS